MAFSYGGCLKNDFGEDLNGIQEVIVGTIVQVWKSLVNGFCVVSQQIRAEPRLGFDFIFLIMLPYLGTIIRLGVLDFQRTERLEGAKKAPPEPKVSLPYWSYQPGWMFNYLLMGFASFMVYHEDGECPLSDTTCAAMGLYVITFLLTWAWSVTLYRTKSIKKSIGLQITAMFLTLLTMMRFSKVNYMAGGLLTPVVTWGFFSLASDLTLMEELRKRRNGWNH